MRARTRACACAHVCVRLPMACVRRARAHTDRTQGAGTNGSAPCAGRVRGAWRPRATPAPFVEGAPEVHPSLPRLSFPCRHTLPPCPSPLTRPPPQVVWVDAAGARHVATPASPEWNALYAGLGLVGVMAELVLQLGPASNTRFKTIFRSPDKDMVADLDRILKTVRRLVKGVGTFGGWGWLAAGGVGGGGFGGGGVGGGGQE
jgi:hypothetical protein